MSSRKKLLFVCLGNICRSPLAESIFRHLIHERGLDDRFEVDSAGTAGYHVGDPPDARGVATARAHGVVVSGTGRQLTPDDLNSFEYVIVMDRSNRADVEALQARKGGTARIHMLREWDPESPGADVPDPYYGARDGFEEVYQIVARSCERLLDELLAETDVG